MHVPYNYLPTEFEDTEEIFDEWKELIKSTDFTLGHYVEEFESIFSDYIGSKYCVATNCGTDALILSMKAIGLGEGDEVITVANTFYATVGAIVECGATPVLVDADDRYQISLTAIEKAITTNTKAIVPVHWAGASPDMPAIINLAELHGLHVIEDACMGIGASIYGQSPGKFGTVNAFSMHPLKSLNVMGDGGMVVTDDDDIAQWMKKYRNHGMVDRDHIEFWGVNMRIQPLQAIVAKHRLKSLKQTIKQRNKNARMLDISLKKLEPFVSIPPRYKNYLETFALYMGLFEKRNELLVHLNEHGVEAKVHYPIPLHKQQAAQKNCICSPSLTNVEQQAEKLITLPVHQYLNEEHMDFIVETIKSFYICK